MTQLVDIRDTAWCNGTSYNPRLLEKATSNIVKNRKTNANFYSITIEHEGDSKNWGDITKEQEKATVSLIKYIYNQIKIIYGKSIELDRDHIIGHYEITPSRKPNCSGSKFPFENIIKNVNKVESKELDDEMITKTEILIDGKKYIVNRILKDGKNYIELRAFEKAGYKIGYKSEENIPAFIK